MALTHFPGRDRKARPGTNATADTMKYNPSRRRSRISMSYMSAEDRTSIPDALERGGDVTPSYEDGSEVSKHSKQFRSHDQ